MPPLPTTLDEEITDLVDATTRLYKDLLEVQIPRLRACIGPLALQQTLAAEVREDIEKLTRNIEAIDLLIWDQKCEKNQRDLKAVVDNFREVLVQLRRDSRAALLASKKAIDAQSRSRRDELLGSGAITEQRRTSEKSTDDALMKAHNDVTDALRRTINLMQGELERSVLSTQLLDASTTSLKSTSSAHDRLTDLMSSSKQLITALEKSDWLDRMLIISAFAFFLLVVMFILKQRIIDRGLRIAFWWTRFLPDFSTDEKLLDLGKTVPTSSLSLSDTTSDATTVSAVLSSAISVIATTATALPSSALLVEQDLTTSISVSPTTLLVTLDATDTNTSPSILSEPAHIEL